MIAPCFPGALAVGAILAEGHAVQTPPSRGKGLVEEAFENLDLWHLEGLNDGAPGTMLPAWEDSEQGAAGTTAFGRREFPDPIATEEE